jgi:replicative DNA helicase
MAQPISQPPADSQLVSLRVPPHSIEAEQSVLGGLLLDNTAWDRIGDVLAVDDFYRDDHRRIYRHIARLIEQGKPADVVTVAESIESSEDQDKAGGLAYLGTLAQNTPSAHNIRRYAEIVHERAVMRRLAAVGAEIADTALNPLGKDVKQLLDEAESRVFQIAEAGVRGRVGFRDIHQLLSQVMERVDFLYSREHPSDITGVSTGFKDLDDKTSGFQEGDLIIIAGRPSMGKAQPLDARVRTPSGWKRMGDLRSGDALASIDDRPSFVTGVFPQGRKTIYRATFSDGRSTECCQEHLWRVHHRAWPQPRVLSTGKIAEMLKRQRYRGRLWIDQAGGEFGHAEALPIDPWVLGALLGDGNLRGVTLRFSTAAAEMLARMGDRVGADLVLEAAGGYDWRIRRADRGHMKGVAGTVANGLVAALEELGLWNLSSHEKFIPAVYLEAGREARLDLLRGLLDTDGWVEKWGSIRFCSTSGQLAKDVASLARSLGGWCSVAEKATTFTYRGERRAGRVAYVCNIHHPDPTSLFLLSDKQRRLPARPRRSKRPTFASIVPTREAEAQCISVSHPSRLYVTDDYVVTHNTALALNIGEHVAVAEKRPVAIFSMEMSGTQIAARMLGSMTRIDQHKLRTGRLTDEDWSKLADGLGKLHDAPIHIDETGALNPLELRSRARRLARQYKGLGMVIVDYLQLMVTDGRREENRATELSEISRSLKALAKELSVPVVALSQLNRSVDQRNDKRPIMSDLRESGALEQDADLILFIYRDEVYNRDTAEKGRAELIIGKQRNGPIGTVDLTFLGQYTRFENYAAAGF